VTCHVPWSSPQLIPRVLKALVRSGRSTPSLPPYVLHVYVLIKFDQINLRASRACPNDPIILLKGELMAFDQVDQPPVGGSHHGCVLEILISSVLGQ
jgi:hypothetical protein